MLALLRKKPALTYCLIGILLAFFILIIWQDEENSMSSDDTGLRGPREPDGFIVNALYRSYDVDGNLSSRIETERAEQFEGEQYALMDRPRGAVFEHETRLPWLISADDGRYDLKTEQLLLLGDVEVIRENPELAPSRLLTERLTLDNRERIVHTEAPVTLLDFRGTTDAVGMRAWIDERVIEFESQVEGEYVTENIGEKP
jgi:lipopolysaccharide export system protein LptC